MDEERLIESLLKKKFLVETSSGEFLPRKEPPAEGELSTLEERFFYLLRFAYAAKSEGLESHE